MRNLFCVLSAVLGLGLAARAGEAEVTGIKAFCRDGQVFVTWKDAAEGREGAKYRYTLYRSNAPITQATVGKAEAVIRGILNNSCKLVGSDLILKDRLDPKWLTCRLTKGGKNLPMWSGVGVHTLTKAGKGYYAVVATDLALKPLSKVVPGQSATTEPVEEKVAPVQPILQVAAGDRARLKGGKISGKKGLPLYVHLHASCSSKPKMRGTGDYFVYFAPRKELGWRAGQPGVFAIAEEGGEQPRLLLSPRDTMNTPGGMRGRENLWFGLLCKPHWATHPEPRAYPFSEQRVEWIVKWVVKTYGADANRISMGGQSMGAWGTFTIGLKRPDIFAALYPTGPKCHQWMLPGIGKVGSILAP